ncbi:MAG TPA: HAD family hydrolase [Candidatus Margulisiibacteriota bacterium]|nr:HAD family hydrolase [Candidatus Margulisiibacteriota bacterium]
MRVIFLDRDGVINAYPGDREYVKSWEEFRFLPQVKLALKKLNHSDCRIFVISNQAGVSKGSYTQEALDEITRNMLKELEKEGITLSGVYYCTHRSEENCSCRKPKTGLLDLALKGLKEKDIKIDLKNSYFVGDTIRDIQTGKSAGLKTILVFSGKEKEENRKNWEILPDFTADGLLEATDLILK